jgi:hypothetical protein
LKVSEVYRKMQENNENAAVDMYSRMVIGALFLIVAISCIIFANGVEKLVGVALFMPTGLAVAGLIMNYNDAKRDLARN